MNRILIANRGEIAMRVMRTAHEMGIETLGVYPENDEDSPHARDRAMHAVAQISDYLDIESVLKTAKDKGADAIHPGYGFLAENPDFARACAEAGIVFIGPTPEAMETLGDKAKAREMAISLGIPVAEGVGPFEKADEIAAAARKLGAPLMLKAAAGGGGKGMKRLMDLNDLERQVETAQRETKAAFGESRLIVERYIYPARHVEVQIFGDGKRAIALGERECSLQRRHQKIIEESPSTAVNDELRERLFDAARKLTEAAGYTNAGTVEFLLGPGGEVYFLEVNTRLQVEHPVTEMCTGLDLVRMQIELAMGGELMAPEEVKREGHAIEARLNAEDPWKDFMPASGHVIKLYWPTEAVCGCRVDTGLGPRVSSHYDSLVAKIISYGATRENARKNLLSGLQQAVLLGVQTNQAFLMTLLESEDFITGATFTTTVDEMDIGERPMPPPLLLAAAAALRGPITLTPASWAKAGRWRLS